MHEVTVSDHYPHLSEYQPLLEELIGGRLTRLDIEPGTIVMIFEKDRGNDLIVEIPVEEPDIEIYED